MEKIVVFVERAAGVSLAAVALLVFVAVVLRATLSINLPDNFDFSRYLQGIAICWGLAVATYRNAHILVDVVWEVSGKTVRRVIDLFASSVSLAFMLAFAWMLVERFRPCEMHVEGPETERQGRNMKPLIARNILDRFRMYCKNIVCSFQVHRTKERMINSNGYFS